MPYRIYEVRHIGSKYRGRIVRIRIPPAQETRLPDVLAECVDTGERFSTPWRALRRIRQRSDLQLTLDFPE